MKKYIIFTDLDGTLLDYDTYSFEKALPALELLKEKNTPLILCSSKTKREIEHYREKLSNRHPFVSENGGGIFIPKDYFKFQISNIKYQIQEEPDYCLIRLGAKYSDLRIAVDELRSKGFNIRGFGDMTVREIADVTGLSIDEAGMAKDRNFDEPFFFGGTKRELHRLFDAVKARGLYHTQGKFYHITGDNNKGKAAAILTGLYRKEYGDITTIGIGDSPNDIPMLKEVDYPVLVQKPEGGHDPRIDLPNLVRVEGIGPEGWNKAVLKLLE